MKVWVITQESNGMDETPKLFTEEAKADAYFVSQVNRYVYDSNGENVKATNYEEADELLASDGQGMGFFIKLYYLDLPGVKKA